MRDDGRFARTPLEVRDEGEHRGPFRSHAFVVPIRARRDCSGVFLVFAATAAADDDDYTYGPDNDLGLFEPDTYASPATDWVPWVQDVPAVAPQVDNSVVCDGCAG